MSSGTTVDATRGSGPDPGVASRTYLVVREGTRAQVILLDEGGEALVGRSVEATVHVDDVKASREHARFVRRDGGLSLVDLGSRNGTRVNGQPLPKGGTAALRSGDVVRIGGVEILVAETAGLATAGAGARAQAELARLLRTTGEAALMRLSVTPAELAQVTPALAGAVLIEEQADGDCACLFEDAAIAEKAAAAIRARVADAGTAVARAPRDGDTLAALWEATDDARPGKATAAAVEAPPGVVVGDPQMVRVFALVKKVAATPTTVLVLGETGAGKEIIAEQLHHQSPRAGGPFIRLNCGSLPETLLESELFGHERGAFTGADKRKIGYIEAAAGGTLFLDEIGELALPMQTRLLRVLENGRFMRVGGREEISVDLRVVAATNRDLEAEAKAGRFRSDLFFRLSAFVIRVPRLRDRPGEIALFALLFARQFAKRMGAVAPTVAPDALEILRRHPWPGNVRELRNVMEYAVVLADQGVIRAEHLPDGLRDPGAAAAGSAASGAAGPVRAQLAEMEERAIREALEAEHGNQTRAAKRLGLSRRALLYKLDKYGLK